MQTSSDTTFGKASLDHPLIPATRVNGTAVYNSAGDKIGSVEDVAIDKVSGRVAYAILSYGGFLGIGHKHHPTPWELLTYDVDRHGYVVPLTREQLEAAPAFEPDALSGWDDHDSRKTIYDYYAPYGIMPYW